MLLFQEIEAGKYHICRFAHFAELSTNSLALLSYLKSKSTSGKEKRVGFERRKSSNMSLPKSLAETNSSRRESLLPCRTHFTSDADL